MRTFKWFLYTWGDLSTHAFNSAYVKAGWSLVGLSPFSPEKMMEAWAFLPDLLKFQPNAVENIKQFLPECAERVVETGTISDTYMHVHAAFELTQYMQALLLDVQSCMDGTRATKASQKATSG